MASNDPPNANRDDKNQFSRSKSNEGRYKLEKDGERTKEVWWNKDTELTNDTSQTDYKRLNVTRQGSVLKIKEDLQNDVFRRKEYTTTLEKDRSLFLTNSVAEMAAVFKKKMSNNEDVLPNIIHQQKVDGSWSFNEDLIRKLGVDPERVRSTQPVYVTMETWMSTFIHGYLTTKIRDQESEWCMSDKKAKKFIYNDVNKKVKNGETCDGVCDIYGILYNLVDKSLTIVNEEMSESSQIITKEIEKSISKERGSERKIEFNFLIDRSGSMEGPKMESVKKCLAYLLKALPTCCKYQIYGFGTSYNMFFESPQPYSDESVAVASAYINDLKADFGLTELVAPLEYIYKFPLIDSKRRKIFLLTDGGVGDIEKVLRLVKEGKNTNKIFPVGIGNDVCEDHIRLIAEECFGKFVLVRESEDVTTSLLQLLKLALEED